MAKVADEGYPTTKSKFWTNELIWNEMTSYLSISDLKAMSLVNKHFFEKFRANSRILFKQTLKTKLKLYAPKLHKAIVEVNTVDEYYLEHFGSEIFEDVIFLELQRLGLVSEEIRNRILKDIVCKCKNLKSLGFGGKNFFSKNYQDFLNDREVKEILSQLEELQMGIENVNYDDDDPHHQELHIGVANNNYDYDDDDTDEEHLEDPVLNFDEGVPRHDDADPLDNFKLFPDLNLKLKKFSYREPEDVDVSLDDSDVHATFFYPELILGSSLNSLLEINLKIDVSGLIRLRALHFPNLLKLRLEVSGETPDLMVSNYSQVFADNLIPFTKRHLDTLKVFALHGDLNYCLKPFCNIFKISKKITLLSFTSDNCFTRSIPSINWDFLQTLTTLRTFQLTMDTTGCDSDADYNDSEDESDDEFARKIRYNILDFRPRKSDLWQRYFAALPSTTTTIRLTGLIRENKSQDLPVTLELERFKNLTELSMLRCPTFLDDNTLQFICSQLTTVRTLKCEFDNITDFGISGRKDDGSMSGISLKNLKGLKELIMSSDGRHSRWNISWLGILGAIRFLELVHLQICGTLKDVHRDGEDYDSKDGYNYLQLIQQNPSMKTCSLKFYQPKYWFRQEALQIHGRLKL